MFNLFHNRVCLGFKLLNYYSSGVWVTDYNMDEIEKLCAVDYTFICNDEEDEKQLHFRFNLPSTYQYINLLTIKINFGFGEKIKKKKC